MSKIAEKVLWSGDGKEAPAALLIREVLTSITPLSQDGDLLRKEELGSSAGKSYQDRSTARAFFLLFHLLRSSTWNWRHFSDSSSPQGRARSGGAV